MALELLHRYWFRTRGGLGYGVTAYSREDATSLLKEAQARLLRTEEIVEVIEDVDMRSLDKNHILPNIGVPIYRGVWFPRIC